jgi:Zn-dependent metalloprotease
MSTGQIKKGSCLIFLLLGLIVGTINIYGQSDKKVGIQSDFVNLFDQKETAKKEMIDRSDSISECIIEKENNSYRIRFIDQRPVRAEIFFQQKRKELGINENDQFILKNFQKDEIGFIHYRYQQTYKGILVEGGEFLLHEKEGCLQTVNGNFNADIDINVHPSISPSQAIKKAKDAINAKKWLWNNKEAEKFLKEATEDTQRTYKPSTQLLILNSNQPDGGDKCILCYKVKISSEEPYGIWDVYIDAKNGDFIKKISTLNYENSRGIAKTLYSGTRGINTEKWNDSYRLRNYTRGKGIEVFDLGNDSTIRNPKEIIDFDNDWDERFYMKRVIVDTVNNDWEEIGERLSSGGKPDLYITIFDKFNIKILTSKAGKNSFSESFSIPPYRFNDPPYTINIYDKDDFSPPDFLGSFIISDITKLIKDTINGTILFVDNNFGANSGTDVAWGLDTIYSFYQTKINRESYDGLGSKIKAYINWGEPNGAWSNDEEIILLSNGYYNRYSAFVGLDFLGHEFTHGVIANNGNGGLVYENESGALNESFADIFGTAIEFFAKPETANWTIGEDIYIQPPYFERSLSDPNASNQPKYYKGYKWRELAIAEAPDKNNDFGGVHKNSGVQNFWFYLLCEGGSSINEKGVAYHVDPIGIEKAIQIVYRSLNFYLGQYATYYNAVDGSKWAAIDLYGSNSPELTAVLNAWKAVGFDTNPACYCSNNQIFRNENGIFGDGSGISNYQNNSDCSWLIKPEGARSITLNFKEFATEFGHDTVVIYDGSTTGDRVLGVFHGSTLPPEIQSTGGEMLLHFLTNDTITSSGWQANYSSDDTISYCSGYKILNSYSGIISDGSNENNYGNNAECSWYIAPPGATSITIEFTDFETEPNKDMVYIYDGNSTNDSLLWIGSGSDSIPTISSTNGEMLVLFTTDGKNCAAGWTAAYSSIGNSFCSDTLLFTEESNNFSDGSGSNNYLNNSDCYFLIQPTGASSILLNFTALDIEYPSTDGKTLYDFLRVYDGADASAQLIGTYTGTTIPDKIVSSGNSLFIHFHSDHVITHSGWSASYTSLYSECCSGTSVLTSPSGAFSDGSGDYNYTNNSNCFWLIQPPKATSVELSFSSFETETGYDGIIIYDGNSVSDPEIGTFTGNVIPPTIFSTGGSLLIQFVSNDTITASGWTANYNSNISTIEESILEYEYWFDNDYNTKVQSKIPSKTNYLFNKLLPTDDLYPGLHSFHIRYKDNNGLWSSVYSDYFHKTATKPSGEREIVAYEYWFNGDYSSKVLNQIEPSKNVNIIDAIDPQTLIAGLHSIHYRYKDDIGQWSSVYSDYFHKTAPRPSGEREIVAYEYWFNGDYSSKVLKQIAPSKNVNIIEAVDPQALMHGLHSIHYRYKDDIGQWSSVYSDYFHKIAPRPSGEREIVAYEYWFNDDYSSKVLKQIAPSKYVNIIEAVDPQAFLNGLHSIHYRYKDDIGQWSSVYSDYFHKLNKRNSQSNLIATYRYWFDSDVAGMQQVSVPSPVSPYELLRDINLCSFPDGNHTIHFQFKDSYSAWSSVLTDTITKIPCVPTPETRTIQNELFLNGDESCFGATQTITVAGSGTTVVFQSGSITNLIAGQQIFILPGFHAQSGSLLNAYITSDGTFCEGSPAPIVAQLEDKSSDQDQDTKPKNSVGVEKTIKIYPNPNNGQFTLELTNIEMGATVRIYNMLGVNIYQSIATNQISNKINLLGIKRGVYFVKVNEQKEQFTRKMIVN